MRGEFSSTIAKPKFYQNRVLVSFRECNCMIGHWEFYFMVKLTIAASCQQLNKVQCELIRCSFDSHRILPSRQHQITYYTSDAYKDRRIVLGENYSPYSPDTTINDYNLFLRFKQNSKTSSRRRQNFTCIEFF